MAEATRAAYAAGGEMIQRGLITEGLAVARAAMTASSRSPAARTGSPGDKSSASSRHPCPRVHTTAVLLRGVVDATTGP